MAKPTVTLTETFNQATVKKGDIFRIELNEGGIAGLGYDDVQVVSGKAKLLSDTREHYDDPHRFEFKAEEVGEIEIVAKGRLYGFGGKPAAENSLHFKIKVN